MRFCVIILYSIGYNQASNTNSYLDIIHECNKEYNDLNQNLLITNENNKIINETVAMKNSVTTYSAKNSELTICKPVYEHTGNKTETYQKLTNKQCIEKSSDYCAQISYFSRESNDETLRNIESPVFCNQLEIDNIFFTPQNTIKKIKLPEYDAYELEKGHKKDKTYFNLEPIQHKNTSNKYLNDVSSNEFNNLDISTSCNVISEYQKHYTESDNMAFSNDSTIKSPNNENLHHHHNENSKNEIDENYEIDIEYAAEYILNNISLVNIEDLILKKTLSSHNNNENICEESTDISEKSTLSNFIENNNSYIHEEVTNLSSKEKKRKIREDTYKNDDSKKFKINEISSIITDENSVKVSIYTRNYKICIKNETKHFYNRLCHDSKIINQHFHSILLNLCEKQTMYKNLKDMENSELTSAHAALICIFKFKDERSNFLDNIRNEQSEYLLEINLQFPKIQKQITFKSISVYTNFLWTSLRLHLDTFVIMYGINKYYEKYISNKNIIEKVQNYELFVHLYFYIMINHYVIDFIYLEKIINKLKTNENLTKKICTKAHLKHTLNCILSYMQVTKSNKGNKSFYILRNTTLVCMYNLKPLIELFKNFNNAQFVEKCHIYGMLLLMIRNSNHYFDKCVYELYSQKNILNLIAKIEEKYVSKEYINEIKFFLKKLSVAKNIKKYQQNYAYNYLEAKINRIRHYKEKIEDIGLHKKSSTHEKIVLFILQSINYTLLKKEIDINKKYLDNEKTFFILEKFKLFFDMNITLMLHSLYFFMQKYVISLIFEASEYIFLRILDNSVAYQKKITDLIIEKEKLKSEKRCTRQVNKQILTIKVNFKIYIIFMHQTEEFAREILLNQMKI